MHASLFCRYCAVEEAQLDKQLADLDLGLGPASGSQRIVGASLLVGDEDCDGSSG